MFLSKMKTAVVGCVAAGLLIAAGGGVVGWASGGQGAAGSQEAPATGSKAGAAAAPAPVENVPEDDKITKDVKRAENESRASAESIGHMEQLAVAIANYEATYGHMPRNVLSASGSPILSWRVALLPYFGEEGFKLSRQFHMDEPWDSKHNKELLIEMPSVFQAGREPSVANTFYQVFDGKTTFYNSWKSVKRTNPLGRAGKLVLIEAGKAVPWTKPVDLPYDDGAPLPPLGGAFPDVIHAVELTGTVHSIPKRFNEKLLRNAITIEAKEPFSWEGLEMPASGVNLTETPAGRPLETALDDPKVTKSAESEQSTEDAKARRVLLEKLNARKIAIENALAKNRAAMAEAAKSVSQLEAQQRIYDVELSVVRQQMAEIEFAKADKKDPRREPAATDDVQDLRSQLEETRRNVRRLRDEVEELKRLLKEKK
jgi:hypothetical protein